MAANDTAALVVALSAQLTKFEKDMGKAVGIADQRTRQIESRFSTMNRGIDRQLSIFASQAAGNLGGVGRSLQSMGRFGLGAAIGLGAAAGAMLALSNATDRYVAKASKIADAADTTGLTISQINALEGAGQRVGLSFEQSEAALTKFLTNLEALRNGGGTLFEALLKIDAGLVRQLSTTKDSAEAVDLLIDAFRRLGSQTEKLAVAKGAGGADTLKILEQLSKGGGLKRAPLINEDEVRRARDLANEIKRLNEEATDLVGQLFAPAQQGVQLTLAKAWLATFQAIKTAVDTIRGIEERPANFKERLGPFAPAELTVNKPSRSDGSGSPSVELAILQRQLALLGDAVTVGEQYRLKKLEIAVAAEKGGLAAGIETRALEAFNVVQLAAVTAAREQLGIATAQQLAEAKLAQLRQDRTKFGLSEQEVQQATVVILKEANEQADRLAVRRSFLPGLKQLELDAKDAAKGFDQLAVSSLNTLADGFVDIITRTKSVSDAFREMVSSILRDLARLLIRQSVLGPLAGLLGGLPGRGGGGDFIGPPIPGNAAGTDFYRGGPTWVGEKGPEIVNLPRGTQIIPNDVARSSAGGVSVSVGGSSVVIQGDASEKTVWLIETALARDRANRGNEIVRTVRAMNSRRVSA